MHKKLSDSQVHQAYELWIEGYSLRYLCKKFGLKNHGSLRERFLKLFGSDYKNKRQTHVLKRLVTKDYLENPRVSIKDKHTISDWLSSLPELNPPNVKLLTNKEELQLSWRETAKKTDYRHIFEVLYSA